MNGAAPGARKIDVLIVARWPVGGIRSYLRYTYGLMARERINLILVGPQSPDLDECIKTLSAFAPRVYKAKSPALLHMAQAADLAMRETRPHLVHSQGYSSALAVAPIARLRGRPQILTIHDMFTEALAKRMSVRLGKIALACAIGTMDVVQPTGPAVEANFRRHLGFWPASRAKIRTIRNAIDVQRFAGDTVRDLRSELGLQPEDFLIGFMGRFMAIKGFHALTRAIEILARRPGLPRKPVVVAIGSGGFVREDAAIIERRSLSQHFRFLPHTDDVPATLRGLDVLAIPSLSEASPILPMEALASGVPVVASSCPGLQDVLNGTPGKLFAVGDTEQLAEALYVEMTASTRHAASSYRSTAAARFDAVRAAAELEAVVHATAGNGYPNASSA